MACPTGYSSGYGKTVYNSPYPITNRCYKIVNTATTFATAQSNCATDGANLMTVRNILEINMIKTQFYTASNKYIVLFFFTLILFLI